MEKKDIENKDEIPMNWWSFQQYVAFPVGIVFSILSLFTYFSVELNNWGKTVIFINILFIIYMCITYYIMIKRSKDGFNIFIAYYFLQPLWVVFVNSKFDFSSQNFTYSFISFLISYGIVFGIFTYPNYIYFKKRKHLFGIEENNHNNVEKEEPYINKEDEEKNETQLNALIDMLEKENKK